MSKREDKRERGGKIVISFVISSPFSKSVRFSSLLSAPRIFNDSKMFGVVTGTNSSRDHVFPLADGRHHEVYPWYEVARMEQLEDGLPTIIP